MLSQQGWLKSDNNFDKVVQDNFTIQHNDNKGQFTEFTAEKLKKLSLALWYTKLCILQDIY